MKPFTTIAVILLTVGAVLQFIRFIQGWEIVVNGVTIPVWVSAIVAPIAVLLAIMIWRENRRTGPEPHERRVN
jgi:heme/copper-type cytochrome/quinol oxidase subunit 2